jgi:hypothetical protein
MIAAWLPCNEPRLRFSDRWQDANSTWLKRAAFRRYLSARLPRGVTVAPEILDLFV